MNRLQPNHRFYCKLLPVVLGALLLLAANGAAQGRFDPKSAGAENELRNLAQFTQELLNFIKQAQAVEANPNAPEAERRRLADLARRVKDGTNGTRTNLQGFIGKIKNANRWTDEFDAEFLDAITSPRVKALIRRAGGARKALGAAEAALNSLAQDVDATVGDTKRAGLAGGGETFFARASFSGARFGAKVRVRCVLLGIGVAAAEITRLKLTAENLDNLFDSNQCGSASPAA